MSLAAAVLTAEFTSCPVSPSCVRASGSTAAAGALPGASVPLVACKRCSLAAPFSDYLALCLFVVLQVR